MKSFGMLFSGAVLVLLLISNPTFAEDQLSIVDSHKYMWVSKEFNFKAPGIKIAVKNSGTEPIKTDHVFTTTFIDETNKRFISTYESKIPPTKGLPAGYTSQFYFKSQDAKLFQEYLTHALDNSNGSLNDIMIRMIVELKDVANGNKVEHTFTVEDYQ